METIKQKLIELIIKEDSSLLTTACSLVILSGMETINKRGNDEVIKGAEVKGAAIDNPMIVGYID